MVSVLSSEALLLDLAERVETRAAQAPAQPTERFNRSDFMKGSWNES